MTSHLVSVTSPAGGDAQRIVATELARVAGLKVADVLALVRPVVALVAVVTLLVRRDANAVLAPEFV